MDDLSVIKKQASEAISSASSLDQLENLRVEFLGKQGKITSQMKAIANLPPEERKNFGQAVNDVKNEVTNLIDKAKNELSSAELNAKLAKEIVDITLPIRAEKQGSIHPVSQVIDECIEIFGAMGFSVAEGPEIETDFHNFTALNIPEEHPARQMHDTFYFPSPPPNRSSPLAGEAGRGDGDSTPLSRGSNILTPDKNERYLLRTHTSPVQIRYMQNNKPPFKIIAPGRTYRCDSDMTHSPMFHQIEGLWIDKDVNMGHLKGCLTEFIHIFFGSKDIPVRFRPSFFPFTEPSAEVDIGCWRENGELKLGAPKNPEDQDWLEILGCGMVHPNVLKNVGVDANEWQGFAFGMGIERIAMLKYGIPDLRTFFESDSRWLKHYGF